MCSLPSIPVPRSNKLMNCAPETVSYKKPFPKLNAWSVFSQGQRANTPSLSHTFLLPMGFCTVCPVCTFPGNMVKKKTNYL